MGFNPPKVNQEQHPPSRRRQPSCGRREGLKIKISKIGLRGFMKEAKRHNHNKAFPSSPNSIREK